MREELAMGIGIGIIAVIVLYRTCRDVPAMTLTRSRTLSCTAFVPGVAVGQS